MPDGEHLRLGVVQTAFTEHAADNRKRVAALIREAAGRGAQIICPPELCDGPYFPKTQDEEQFAQAAPWREHPQVMTFQALAAELDVVVLASIFERDGPHYYNSVVVIDADGAALGVYRKAHIPDGPGYQEKFYFRPGNTAPCVWETRYARLGVAICWDQWFPETARALALLGAEAIVYPTAIGAEPQDPTLDTSGAWRRVMQGHAAANRMPVAAANRIGVEAGQRFYGQSFITDESGAVAAELGEAEAGVAVASFKRAELAQARAAWGFFRDRRPDLYDALVRR